MRHVNWLCMWVFMWSAHLILMIWKISESKSVMVNVIYMFIVMFFIINEYLKIDKELTK
jgi:hypothetical protein